jgi:anti-anti-sigma factor
VKVEDLAGDIVAFEFQREPQMNGELGTVISIVTERPGCSVILDFSSVDIITSSSLTKLLKLRQTLLGFGRHLVICSIHPFTKSAFEVTGLDGVFEFVDDKFIALASLQLVN